MRTALTFVAIICCSVVVATAQTRVGPARGSLVIQGGGSIQDETWNRFIELAGGVDAKFVFIPTADEPVDPANPNSDEFPLDKVKHLTVLHTRCRAEADSEAFVAALKDANGVWFGGGSSGRLVDAYLNTRTQRAIEEVLARGGVIGGSSAGASIQGSYLMRGRLRGIRRRREVQVSEGYEEGFAYLKEVAIDQHIDAKGRVEDMSAVVAAHPGLLGLGLEESTTIIVRGDVAEVLGTGRVAVTDGQTHDGKAYFYLHPGDFFDLAARRVAHPN